MNSTKLNDYELIYLIKEGNEIALGLMFDKYERYIWSIVLNFYIYNLKAEDLVQQGRLCLYRSIFMYNASLKVSFFRFFTICLKRTLLRELQNNYYKVPLLLKDNTTQYGNNKLPGLSKLLTKEELDLYEHCFVLNYSVREYAKKKNISFYKMKMIYDGLLQKVKENYGL